MSTLPVTPKDRSIPLILIGLGVAGLALAPMIRGAQASGAVINIVMATIHLAIFLVVGLGLASMLSIGLGDMKSAALKFTGICLFSSAVAAMIPLGLVIAFVVFMALTMWLFEIEVPYGAGFAVVFTLIALLMVAVVAFTQAPTLTR